MNKFFKRGNKISQRLYLQLRLRRRVLEAAQRAAYLGSEKRLQIMTRFSRTIAFLAAYFVTINGLMPKAKEMG